MTYSQLNIHNIGLGLGYWKCKYMGHGEQTVIVIQVWIWMGLLLQCYGRMEIVRTPVTTRRPMWAPRVYIVASRRWLLQHCDLNSLTDGTTKGTRATNPSDVRNNNTLTSLFNIFTRYGLNCFYNYQLSIV